MLHFAYILAASHSGSTLLAMLLNTNPEICSVGELKATNLGDVECYRCSCGELIRECHFWNRVSDAMARRGLKFDITDSGTHFSAGGSAYAQRLLRPLHRGPLIEAVRDAALRLSPAWRARLPEIQRRNVALAASLREVTGKKIVVDSSKIGLRLKYLLRDPDLDVKVIRLVRDGRAVALTYTDPARFADASDPGRRGGGCGGDRNSERLSLAQAAREWRRSNEEAEHILARLHPSRWCQVRYEDLCSRPEATLAALFTFLNAGAPPRRDDFRRCEHHVIGNGMRLDAHGDIRLDASWRSTLSAEDLALFERVAGKLNRMYGYE